MREELEKLVGVGMLETQHVNALVMLASSGYCYHRSWGYGKITTVDTVAGRLLIDFQSKTGHGMDLVFAAQSLKAIPKDHIIARKMSDLGSLKQMAAMHHLDLVKLVLQSFGGRATADQIQQALSPDVIADDWKKWWDAAKREMKKDGHFQVPVKKTEPIVYNEQEVSQQHRLLKELRAAKGLKARVAVATELDRSAGDLTDKKAAAIETVAMLNADIASHQRTMPALALEAIFLRDDLRQVGGLEPQPGEVQPLDVWTQGAKLGEVLETLPGAKHRKALVSYRDANPNLWADGVLALLNGSTAKICGELAGMLIAEGKFDKLKETLSRLIGQHAAHSELLLWLARERENDSFADILGPELFRAMLTAIERDQFNEKKSNKLRDFILSDKNLMVELISSAELEVIKDLTRALQLSAAFDDMDKRSLLARIVKEYPVVQSLITGDQTKQDNSLIVSWESLERRKVEYEDLVKKKIPGNSKEIAVARSYGDLRENHEYKAAKEMQKVLMRRKSELEVQLNRARGTDFANVRTDVVSIGTKVTVHDVNNQKAVIFKVCGAWDSDPDNGIIAYLSPIGQALLNHPVGDEVEFELQGTKHKFRIDAIEALPPAAKPMDPAAAPTPVA
ncbi:MAG: GreA/GreB family elongation factor [Verrucomicrobia bacterium]|nr:GreA/GreB family elongation factor [Verrucomicrobiota bacterium]